MYRVWLTDVLSKRLEARDVLTLFCDVCALAISLEKESEALRLKVKELERKAMRQEVKVQERQSSTKKQRL